MDGYFTALKTLDMWDVNTSVAIEALEKTKRSSIPNQVNWRPGKESSRSVFKLLGESRCSQLTIQSVDLDPQDLASLFQSSWQSRSVRFLNCGFLDRASSSSESSDGAANPEPSVKQPFLLDRSRWSNAICRIHLRWAYLVACEVFTWISQSPMSMLRY